MFYYTPVSNADRNIFAENGSSPGNDDANGKTLYTGSLSGVPTVIIAGQSNVCNSFPSVYTPTNTTVYNLNIYDGAVYKLVDPVLGCSTNIPAGNFAGRLADKMITAGNVSGLLTVPVGIDGTAIASWQSSTDLASRILVAIRRLANRGITPDAILWGQGESDIGTSQSAYTTYLNTLIALTRTEGFTGPWFIAKQTMFAGVVHAAVQNAQTGIVDHNLGIWAGPDSDSISAAFRQDGTHFTDAGANLYAGLWQTALRTYGSPF